MQQLRRRRREHDPAGRGLLDQRLPQHPVLEAVALREAAVVAVAVAGEQQRHLTRLDAPVAGLPALDPGGVDLRALALLLVGRAQRAQVEHHRGAHQRAQRELVAGVPALGVAARAGDVDARRRDEVRREVDLRAGVLGDLVGVDRGDVLAHPAAAAGRRRAPPAPEPGERDDLELRLVGEGDRVLLAGRHRQVDDLPAAAGERPADRRRGRAGLRRPGLGRSCRPRRERPPNRPPSASPAPLVSAPRRVRFRMRAGYPGGCDWYLRAVREIRLGSREMIG